MRNRFRHKHRNRLAAGNSYPCTCSEEDKSDSVPLKQAEPGSHVRVCCLNRRGHIARRLAEMGFTPGTDVIVLRKAPLSDPIEYQIRGYLVSLRHEEAEIVLVKPVSSCPQYQEAEIANETEYLSRDHIPTDE